MGTTEQPKAWREGRRLRAWELHHQGWKQKDIAAALGVTQGAVSQWLARGRAGGRAGLRRRTAPGAPRRVSDAQRARLPELLARGAEAFGFTQRVPGDVWTMSDGYSVPAAGVSSRRSNERPSAMKQRLLPGALSAGPKAKQSGARRADARLDRRIWLLPVAGACPHLCPVWGNAAVACAVEL